MRRDLGAGLDPAVDARIGGERDVRQPAAGGQEVLAGILGVEPHLDRGAARRRRDLRERRQLAGGLAHHPLDQIHAGDRFGPPCSTCRRVFTSRVEGVAVVVVDELDRARRFIGDVLAEAHGRGMHRGAGRLGQARRRRFLDDLLVAPLQRAVALAEREHAAPSPKTAPRHDGRARRTSRRTRRRP
jgi:hypothetical protein